MPSFEDRTPEAATYFREAFGLEELPGRVLYRSGTYWLTSSPELLEGVTIHAVGIPLLREQRGGLKPTSFGLSLLGDRLRRGVVELGREELLALLLGRTLPREGRDGYVALRYQDEVLGCGQLKGGKLRSLIPRARRQELLSALATSQRV